MTNAAVRSLEYARRELRAEIERYDAEIVKREQINVRQQHSREVAAREFSEITKTLQELRGIVWYVVLGDGHQLPEPHPTPEHAQNHINDVVATLNPKNLDPRWTNAEVVKEEA